MTSPHALWLQKGPARRCFRCAAVWLSLGVFSVFGLAGLMIPPDAEWWERGLLVVVVVNEFALATVYYISGLWHRARKSEAARS